jgi:hypothetical protein
MPPTDRTSDRRGGWLLRSVVVVLWALALVVAHGLGARVSGGGSDSGPTLEASLTERNPLHRSFEVSRFLSGLAERDIDDALHTVETAGLLFDPQEYLLLMTAWVAIDPNSPYHWALAQPGLLERRALDALFDALGFFDAPMARELINSLEWSDSPEGLHLHMVQGWARSDHKADLTDYIEALPTGVLRQQAARALVNEILKGGPDALIAWADGIPIDAEGGMKEMAFKKAAYALSQVVPARTAQWFDAHRGRTYSGGALKVITLHWLERDPASAMDWIVELPGSDRRSDLVKRSFKSWVALDADAAQKWALGASPAPGVDPAVRVLVRRHFEQRPAEAMDWAFRIHAREPRQRVLLSAGRGWLRKDRDAFMAWLPESGLGSQVRDLILNTPTRGERDAARQLGREAPIAP